MAKKVTTKVVHFGETLRIINDGLKKPYEGRFSYYFTGYDWFTGDVYMSSWRWRDFNKRNKGRNVQNLSGKKEKKFWRKVHRHIERFAPQET